jgi:hypothetical protein
LLFRNKKKINKNKKIKKNKKKKKKKKKNKKKRKKKKKTKNGKKKRGPHVEFSGTMNWAQSPNIILPSAPTGRQRWPAA